LNSGVLFKKKIMTKPFKKVAESNQLVSAMNGFLPPRKTKKKPLKTTLACRQVAEYFNPFSGQ
jgi:hypothetical protein